MTVCQCDTLRFLAEHEISERVPLFVFDSQQIENVFKTVLTPSPIFVEFPTLIGSEVAVSNVHDVMQLRLQLIDLFFGDDDSVFITTRHVHSPFDHTENIFKPCVSVRSHVNPYSPSSSP